MNAGEQLALKRFTALYGNPKPGAQGSTGPTGNQGIAGRATNTGATGPDGQTGPTGQTGPVGTATNTGATGPTGNTGSKGPAGYSSGQVLYLQNRPASGSYSLADITINPNATPSSVNTFLTDSKIQLANFITPSTFPNAQVIPSGTFNFVLSANLTGALTAEGNPVAIMYAQIYKRTNANETLLLTSECSKALPYNTQSQITFDCVCLNPIALETGDRLVFKIFSQLLIGDDNTEITIQYEDPSTVYSHIHTPFGALGTVGPTGQTGPQGPAGYVGPKGSEGATGPTASASTGATGITGCTGTRGVDGPTGPQGPAGIQGPPGPQAVRSQSSMTMVPSNHTDYALTVVSGTEGNMYVIPTNATALRITVSVASTLEPGLYYSLKNYSANDVDVLLSINGAAAVEMNANDANLPTAVLNKFRGSNPPSMCLFWNGNTMVLV